MKKRSESNDKYNSTNLAPKAGKKNGLKVILDAHYDKVTFGSVFDDVSGMQVFLGEPEEFAIIGERGKVIEPGKEHFLDISGYVVKAESELRTLSPRNRKCYFPDEYPLARPLQYYSNYTAANCRLECGIADVEQELHCVPWYLPQGEYKLVIMNQYDIF